MSINRTFCLYKKYLYDHFKVIYEITNYYKFKKTYFERQGSAQDILKPILTIRIFCWMFGRRLRVPLADLCFQSDLNGWLPGKLIDFMTCNGKK